MKDIALIVHFIGLAMGVGTGFAFMFVGMASERMEAAEAQKFRVQALALSTMGHTGLILMILSGIYLMTPFWNRLMEMPWLIAKLVLVLLLTVAIWILHAAGVKAKKGDVEIQLKKIDAFGKAGLLISLAILIVAVYVFH